MNKTLKVAIDEQRELLRSVVEAAIFFVTKIGERVDYEECSDRTRARWRLEKLPVKEIAIELSQYRSSRLLIWWGDGNRSTRYYVLSLEFPGEFFYPESKDYTVPHFDNTAQWCELLIELYKNKERVVEELSIRKGDDELPLEKERSELLKEARRLGLKV